ETTIEVRSHPDRQPSFANPARPDQADQPRLPELPSEFRQHAAAPDETRRFSRQVACAAAGPRHGEEEITTAASAGRKPDSIGVFSVIPLISALGVVRSLRRMTEEPPVQRVEVSFVGTPPLLQVKRASGVSEVEVNGAILRCLVCGSFQPFLEALRGHEVISLKSTSTRGEGEHADNDKTLRTQPADRVVRAAGALYLLLVVTSIFGFVTPQTLIVAKDAAATAHNILASEALFRLAIVSGLIATIAFVFLARELYRLLRDVNEKIGRAHV